MKPQLVPWDHVSKYIYHSDTLFIDLRDEEEYAQGHVTGAWNIPYDEWQEHISEMNGYDRVVFYCDRGSRSLSAARILARYGQRSFSVAGGYEAIRRAGG